MSLFYKNSAQTSQKHFWNHRNDLISLDYVMKVQTAEQYVSAYTRRHAVGIVSTWSRECNKLNTRKVISVSSSTYTTALGIRQEVEQIRANVFCSTFFNGFYFF